MDEAKRNRPEPESLGLGDSEHTDTSMLTTTERPELRSWR